MKTVEGGNTNRENAPSIVAIVVAITLILLAFILFFLSFLIAPFLLLAIAALVVVVMLETKGKKESNETLPENNDQEFQFGSEE